jgi:hypothetical protein
MSPTAAIVITELAAPLRTGFWAFWVVRAFVFAAGFAAAAVPRRELAAPGRRGEDECCCDDDRSARTTSARRSGFP